MKESRIEKQTIDMLVAKGYSKEQIELSPRINDLALDIVVFDKKDNVITKNILIVIEIKNKAILLPLSKNQLETQMLETNADYGMVYNGKEKICLVHVRRGSNEDNSIHSSFEPIAEIPSNNQSDNKRRLIYQEEVEEVLSYKARDESVNFDYFCIERLSWLQKEIDLIYSENYLPPSAVTNSEIRAKNNATRHYFIIRFFLFLKEVSFSKGVTSSYAHFEEVFGLVKELEQSLKKEKINDNEIKTKISQLAEIILRSDSYIIEDFLRNGNWKIYSIIDLLKLFDLDLLVVSRIVELIVRIPFQSHLKIYNTLWGSLINEFSILNKKLPKTLLLNIPSPLHYLVWQRFGVRTIVIAAKQKFNEPKFEKITLVTRNWNQYPEDSDRNFRDIGTNTTRLERHEADPVTWIRDYPHGKYDLIISMPPIGGNLTRDEHGHLLKTIELAKPGAKIVFLLGANLQFARSGSAVQTRKQIMKDCILKGIIQLPPRFFREHGVSTFLLILEKRSSEELNKKNMVPILNVPSEDDFILQLMTWIRWEKSGTLDENNKHLVEHSFLLSEDELTQTWTILDKSPAFKKLTEIKDSVRLGDVITNAFSPARSYQLFDVDSKLQNDKSKTVDYLRISDFSKNNKIKSKIEKQKIMTPEDHRKSSIFLKDDDIVISRQGTVGKVAIVKTAGRKILASPQLVVLRLDTKKILPDYLLHQLQNEKTREQIKKLTTGNLISRISTKSITLIRISLPPLYEQQQIVKKYQKLDAEIAELEKKLASKRKELSEV